MYVCMYMCMYVCMYVSGVYLGITLRGGGVEFALSQGSHTFHT